jgi:hypothetical protein
MDDIFTPRISRNSDERLEMKLSPEYMAKIKTGTRWKATVTDVNTGIRYAVEAAACNLPRCYCDGVIVSILDERGSNR